MEGIMVARHSVPLAVSIGRNRKLDRASEESPVYVLEPMFSQEVADDVRGLALSVVNLISRGDDVPTLFGEDNGRAGLLVASRNGLPTNCARTAESARVRIRDELFRVLGGQNLSDLRFRQPHIDQYLSALRKELSELGVELDLGLVELKGL